MGTKFFILFLIVIGGLGVVYFAMVPDLAVAPAPENTNDTTPLLQTYRSEEYGISFTYPSTYELREIDADSALRIHHTILLQRKADLPPPQGGEGPPSITIDIYQNNLDNRTTEDWIRGDSRSNFKLGDGNIASTTVSGMPALSYRWSGLYNGTTVAIARPAWVYAFSVTYFEMGEDIVQDFAVIRESIRLQ